MPYYVEKSTAKFGLISRQINLDEVDFEYHDLDLDMQAKILYSYYSTDPG